MHNLNKITKILGATVALAASNIVLAEDVTVPATVTVDNTIDFTFTGSLDFGILRATGDQDSGECSGITIPADPAEAINTDISLSTDAIAACPAGVGTNTSIMQSIGGTIARPVFTITGIANFTQLSLSLPDTTVAPIFMKLDGGQPATAPDFALYDFTAYQTSGTAVDVTMDATGNGSVTADNAGIITFTLGATITTDPDTFTTSSYQDSTAYVTTLPVTVDYP